MSRLLVILYQLDGLVLALLTLGDCKIGETISSVVWELECDGKWQGKVLRPAIDAVLFFDASHCFKAWRTYQKITKNSQ